ncbi:HAD-IIIC family phosphatase [Pseudovibrio ascidiaceicola]|uniref:HAD-IIIC family phosphatase n=1 Tax=Pseudovibrio ascidiaceicola TaxID=285279 RepID=UPI000D69CBB3|nr:HAD-IIIC family phosphatase [Pseudovibrio ascidiaceicola]
MDLFSYPFKSNELFRSRKKIKKALAPRAKRELKIHVLSGATVGELSDLIEVFLLRFGIQAEISVGDYNQFYEEALFGGQVELTAPDWVYVHTSIKNIRRFPKIFESQNEISTLIETEVKRITDVASKMASSGRKVIINTVEMPELRVMGGVSATRSDGSVNFVRKINEKIVEFVEENDAVFLNDIEYQSSVVGLDRWYDWNYWSAFKYPYSPEVFPWVASSIASTIASAEGASKKLLVCDLDNTLWGGVIGDEGPDQLKLGPDTPKGEMFLQVQSYLSVLKDRGVALAVNSKNELNLAEAGFDLESSALSRDDFAAFYANWKPKSDNIKDIAAGLNLGTDSFVFIDDNKAEIQEVNLNCPEVLAVSYDKNPIELIRQIDRSGFFDPNTISTEDAKRTDYYKKNQRRKQLETQASSIEGYLSSLNMISNIFDVEASSLERVVQLINKTNQFNPTTSRTDHDQLRNRITSRDHIVLAAKLSDQFGDSGIVSALEAKLDGNNATINTWVMSCRVFNRTLEYAIFDMFVERCKAHGVNTISAKYISSAKNKYVKNLYSKLGFDVVEDIAEEKIYKYFVSNSKAKLNKHIEIKYG